MASDGSGSQQPQSPPPSGSSGAFAYQTRLLERTASLSRSGSVAARGVFPQPTGSTPSGTRRWTPSHRVGQSIDLVRNRWEERERTDVQDVFNSIHDATSPDLSSSTIPTPEVSPAPSRTTTFAQMNLTKRHTLASPVSTPIVPQVTTSTTGSSSSSSAPLSPNSGSFPRPESPSVSSVRRYNQFTSPVRNSATVERTPSFPPRIRSYTLESPLSDSGPRGSPAQSSSADVEESPSRDAVSHRLGTLRRTDSITARDVPTTPTSASPSSSVSFGFLRRALPDPTTPTSPTTHFASVRRPPSVEPASPSPTSQFATLRRTPSTEARPRPRPQSVDFGRDALRHIPTDLSPLPRPPIQTTRFEESPQLSTRSPSVMTPTPYRSSYMANKKAGLYGDSPAAIGRKLGRHLPRIASGDGNDDWPLDKGNEDDDSDTIPVPRSLRRRDVSPLPPLESHEKDSEREKDREREERERKQALEEVRRDRRARRGDWVRDEKPLPTQPMSPGIGPAFASPTKTHFAIPEPPAPISPITPTKTDLVLPELPGDDVTGMRGRLRLSRKPGNVPANSAPQPSATRFGLWADVQRHLLQAYEYLCHVGEAQQWIEGCLGEELEFGVVEMEEGLRNGVVLARLANGLVKEWNPSIAIRRVYEHPKLSFRHSDNINIFLDFVRNVGLPEGFIFELTDLYDKKNIPKVIYCIHALSHLLARRGLANRMGNLLGRLQFSDDQLRQTQKGLKDAGVPMPNFSAVGRELAREINEEPEETEEERRDRELEDARDSVIALQTISRGFLARKAHAARLLRLRIAERYIVKMQAHSRGAIVRQEIKARHSAQEHLTPWVIALQAVSRGIAARRRWKVLLARIYATNKVIQAVQAQVRGVLVRRRFARIKAALRTSKTSFVRLQAVARAKVVRRSHSELSKTFLHAPVATSIIAIQAACRGLLERRKAQARQARLLHVEPTIVGLQARSRGVLIRRRVRAQLAKLDDVGDIVVRIQAAARAFLARRRLLLLIRALRKVSPTVSLLQAQARAKLLRQKQQHLSKSLHEVKVVTSVTEFQALARAALMRNRGIEILKQLEFYAPDVVYFQAACRGALVRDEFWAWRRYLHESQDEAIYLQKLIRGLMTRRAFQAKLQYYRANLHKVVKIQALFRAKETREQYRQLTVGKNVSINTIKNFVHLLDDSEADFEDEIDVERMRKKVVEGIREVQNLENEVADLDVKIGLVVNNVKSFEEVVKSRRRYDTVNAHSSRASVLAAHGDPFAGPNTLDAATRRKLELYQQLFYLLQTRPEYFSRLFYSLSRLKLPDKSKRTVERVALTLFGYGQDRREEYLLLKTLQASAVEEIKAASTMQELFASQPMYIDVAVQYVKAKQVPYVKDTLQALIRTVVDEPDLDLETNPVNIYLNRVNIEEMRSGVISPRRKDIQFHEAAKEPETRAEFIRHLQKLHALTKDFVHAITHSTRRMPYGMRCLARETLQAIKQQFPNEPEETYAAYLGRLIYYRYINPAILAPETFDIVSTTLGTLTRKNLNEISKMLKQISSGVIFTIEGDDVCLTPLNDYVEEAIKQMNTWFFEVADIEEPENHFHAHEFLDVTVQPKPIFITPNEVYSMHTMLIQHMDQLVIAREDPLSVIVHELDGVPHVGSDELRDARDRAIALELTNRFANVQDPHAEEKALWVQAKRGVLAILRVHPSADLYDALVQAVTDEHEAIWADIVDNQVAADRVRHRRNRRMPSTTGQEAAYRLEDIQSLSFREVKMRAIQYLLELEKLGKVTRTDGYQAILNAIAGDVRSKHMKRVRRHTEIESMQDALRYLAERKKYFEEQLASYNHYVENTMSTMQRGKGKKRFVMPFTKQFFHQREMQRTGHAAQFGSFKYSAQEFYEKGILLSMDQFSPRQFDKIDVVISSDKMNVFTMQIYNNAMGINSLVASTEVRMEDLLQAQFENRISLPLFDGMVKVHVNLLLFQVNKKFYV